MKLVYAIVRNDNEDDVVSQLTRHHYSITRLSTSIIKQECGQHQKITVNMPYISGTTMVNYSTMPMTVEVGGAIIFVVDVEHYEKI